MEEPSTSTSPKKPEQTRFLPRPDLSGEKEIIDSIDASHFIDGHFDAVDYELKKLAAFDDLCMNDVDRERIRLKAQLQVITKKIAALVIEKSPSYSSQIEDMNGIREELRLVIQRVQTIRKYLKECASKSSYTLGVLAVDRSRRLLFALKAKLLQLKTLHETEYRIQELLEDGKYPLAIRVCVEALEAAKSYAHLSCVNELSAKLRNSSAALEHSLDGALSSLVCTFHPDKYLLVFNAFRLLGKTEDAASRLVTLSCAALERRARQVIAAEAMQADPEVAADTAAYEKLCEMTPCDRVAEALRELGHALCQILMNIHSILAVHAEEEERESIIDGEASSIVTRTLSSSLYTIFRTALIRFNTLLCCHDFAQLKFDDVLAVIEMATKFRLFGRRHFGHAALEIDVSLEKQSALFFQRQHMEKMDELRMFIENEAFAVCPLPDNFTLFELQEFSFLRESRESREDSPSSSEDGVGEALDYATIPVDAPNPFAPPSSTSDGDGKKKEKKKRRETDDGASDVSSTTASARPPNLCNAALMVLRLLGRYIRMTSLLHSIADRSILAITQLFEYFLYSTVTFFARDGTEFALPSSTRLERVLRRIDDGLFNASNSHLPHPSLSCAVQLEHADRLFALPERIVAIESIEFVARQLDLTRPVIEGLPAPSDAKSAAILQSFYAEVLAVVPQVRKAVMNTVASRALKLPLLISTVGTTQWGVTELQSKHSTYVDFLLQDMEVYSLRLKHCLLELPFHDESLDALLWERLIETALRALVQGYGQVGARCTNEGRALMQLDVQHLAGRLEKMTGRKCTEQIEYVSAYVKAYYLPERNLEEWALAHREYTAEQIISLLAAATHVSKKTRTRIINALSG